MQGYFQLNHVVQSSIQPDLECFQGQGCPSNLCWCFTTVKQLMLAHRTSSTSISFNTIVFHEYSLPWSFTFSDQCCLFCSFGIPLHSLQQYHQRSIMFLESTAALPPAPPHVCVFSRRKSTGSRNCCTQLCFLILYLFPLLSPTEMSSPRQQGTEACPKVVFLPNT